MSTQTETWNCKKIQDVLGELPWFEFCGTVSSSTDERAELCTRLARDLPFQTRFAMSKQIPSSYATCYPVLGVAHVRVRTHTLHINGFYFWKVAWEAECLSGCAGRLRTTGSLGLEGISAGSTQSIILPPSRSDLTIPKLSPKDGCQA